MPKTRTSAETRAMIYEQPAGYPALLPVVRVVDPPDLMVMVVDPDTLTFVSLRLFQLAL